MGFGIEHANFSADHWQQFDHRLRAQLQQLKTLLSTPGFGISAPSVGAELEYYIVDRTGVPAPINTALLAAAKDPQLTLELNRFNLEYNFQPLPVMEDVFSRLRAAIDASTAHLNAVAAVMDAQVVPIGILPTLEVQHLGRAMMTNTPRYQALDKALRALRGESTFDVHIQGAQDDVHICQPDVTLEGANTSFQFHYKVAPNDFAHVYNAVQLLSAVVLGLSANSPLLFGKRLWHETRIPLFRQSIDSRAHHEWRMPARISFGHGWVRASAYELFAEGVHLFPALLPQLFEQDPCADIPELAELRLHQGTIWTWNRAIYDPADGGHCRIEMRALPAGPGSVDMVASAACLLGMALAMRHEMEEWLAAMPFSYAETNFYRAAREGLDATLIWPDMQGIGLKEQALTDVAASLLPRMVQGLRSIGVSQAEAEGLLAVMEQRIAAKQTGAIWQLKALAHLEYRHDAITARRKMLEAYMRWSHTGLPVAQWGLDA